MPDISAVAQVVFGVALLRIGRVLADAPGLSLTLAGSVVALVGVFVGVYGLFGGVEAAVSAGTKQESNPQQEH